LEPTLALALAAVAIATTDSLHVAVAVVNDIEFLLTWNCTHLANAGFIPKIREQSEARGLFLSDDLPPETLIGI
jgi:hypothetical protein